MRIIDRDLALSYHFEAISMHDDCGALIDSKSKQIGMGVDYLQEIVLAVAREEVLVDGGFVQ